MSCPVELGYVWGKEHFKPFYYSSKATELVISLSVILRQTSQTGLKVTLCIFVMILLPNDNARRKPIDEIKWRRVPQIPIVIKHSWKFLRLFKNDFHLWFSHWCRAIDQNRTRDTKLQLFYQHKIILKSTSWWKLGDSHISCCEGETLQLRTISCKRVPRPIC